MCKDEQIPKVNFLSRYKSALREVKRLAEELNALRDLENHVSLDAAIKNIAAVETLLEEKTAALMVVRGDVEKSIEQIEDEKLKAVLKYRYINCLSLEAVAERLDYSYQWTWELEKKALSKLKVADGN